MDIEDELALNYMEAEEETKSEMHSLDIEDELSLNYGEPISELKKTKPLNQKKLQKQIKKSACEENQVRTSLSSIDQNISIVPLAVEKGHKRERKEKKRTDRSKKRNRRRSQRWCVVKKRIERGEQSPLKLLSENEIAEIVGDRHSKQILKKETDKSKVATEKLQPMKKSVPIYSKWKPCKSIKTSATYRILYKPYKELVLSFFEKNNVGDISVSSWKTFQSFLENIAKAETVLVENDVSRKRGLKNKKGVRFFAMDLSTCDMPSIAISGSSHPAESLISALHNVLSINEGVSSSADVKMLMHMLSEILCGKSEAIEAKLNAKSCRSRNEGRIRLRQVNFLHSVISSYTLAGEKDWNSLGAHKNLYRDKYVDVVQSLLRYYFKQIFNSNNECERNIDFLMESDSCCNLHNDDDFAAIVHSALIKVAEISGQINGNSFNLSKKEREEGIASCKFLQQIFTDPQVIHDFSQKLCAWGPFLKRLAEACELKLGDYFQEWVILNQSADAICDQLSTLQIDVQYPNERKYTRRSLRRSTRFSKKEAQRYPAFTVVEHVDNSVCKVCSKLVLDRNVGGEIVCDKCGRWYHLRCLGLPKSYAKIVSTYACPSCAI